MTLAPKHIRSRGHLTFSTGRGPTNNLSLHPMSDCTFGHSLPFDGVTALGEAAHSHVHSKVLTQDACVSLTPG